MNIIICGLIGTGKTTLSKKIAKQFGFNYINDYEICKNGLKKSEIMQFINKNDNFVVDLCYSLSPKDCINLTNNIIYFLGFVSIDERLLLSLFQAKGENISLEKIKQNKELCTKYCKMCKKYNIPFVDINRDRKEIINNILEEIKEKLCLN